MPFDSVILFLGIHPENIIQKYVKFFIHKNVHHRSIQNRKKKKKPRTNGLPYNRGMIQETMICPLERK